MALETEWRSWVPNWAKGIIDRIYLLAVKETEVTK